MSRQFPCLQEPVIPELIDEYKLSLEIVLFPFTEPK